MTVVPAAIGAVKTSVLVRLAVLSALCPRSPRSLIPLAMVVGGMGIPDESIRR